MRNISLALLAAAVSAGEYSLNAWSNTQDFGADTRHPLSFELSGDVNVGYELPLEFAANDVDLQWSNNVYAKSVVSAILDVSFLNEALSNTFIGLNVEADFTVGEFYFVNNVLTYF